MHKYNVVVFTDIAKAFDSVPISKLTYAIWNSNIPPVYKRVITSFTKDRRFKVELRSPDNKVVSSKWKKQLYGIPQGSVLGPLLWNLFFDPLLDSILENNSMRRGKHFCITLIAGNHPRFNDMDITPYGY